METGESRGTTDSLEVEEPEHAATLHNDCSFHSYEVFKREPAIEVSKKPYSLQPDIATGWVPKMKVIGPVPLNFDCGITDAVVSGILQHARLPNYYRVLYLEQRTGSRPASSFRMHEELAQHYHFKYDHLYRNNYSHLQPFYRKFYAEFQPQTARSFRGMNPTIEDAEVTFDSSFESGNLDAAVRVVSGEYDLFMRIDSNTRGHLQWYYFRVRNNGLKRIKLNLVNFRRKRTLYERGMKPFIRPQFGEWRQAGENITFQDKTLRFEFLRDDFDEYELLFKELSFEYEFQSKSEEVEFAYSVPYTYSQLTSLLRELPINFNEEEIVKQRSMCESLSGVEIPLITVTDGSSQSKKKCVFIVGRQHPGESNGSYVMEGFLRWICSDHPEAVRLRATAVIKIVPMLNPDGVIMGNFRTSMCGKDLNRLFKSKNCLMYPQVEYLKEEVMAAKKEFKNRFMLFMDFHGHSVRKNVFTYGPGFFLGQTNYYRSRIFPKIISNQTKMFRYYSCSFRISEHKQSTARAMISRIVPFCYTVEASNSSYYCAESRENVDFTQGDWVKVGRDIGVSSFYYLDMIIEEEKEAKARMEKLREKKQGKEKDRRQKEEDFPENTAMAVTSKKISQKTAQTSKNTPKKPIRDMLVHQTSAQLTPVNRPNIARPEQHKYSENRIIEQIKQAETAQRVESEEIQEIPDGSSDHFESAGEDSESAQDDLSSLELKKFHKAASFMLLDFENVFLKRNNSDHSVPKSLNTTTVKKRRTNRDKRTTKKNKSQYQQVNVMACLKSKMCPVEQQPPQPPRPNRLEKFKSFQILEPLGRARSIKQLTEEGARFERGEKFELQILPPPQRILPTRNLRPIPARNSKTRNTISERPELIEMAEIQRFDSLQKIQEQPDSISGQISSCLRNYEVERDRHPPRLIDRPTERQKQSFNAVAGKIAWLNMVVPKRDRRGEYLQQARQRLKEYLIRQNIGPSVDKEFQASRIRVRNLSKNKDKE